MLESSGKYKHQLNKYCFTVQRLKKRILIFYDHFYPAYKAGGPVQSLVNLVRALYNAYDFYIVCKPHEMNETAPLNAVKINEWNRWEDKAQVMYWNYSWKRRSELKQLMEEVKPDTIFINGLFSLYFNILPLKYGIGYKNKHRDCTVVLSARGMLHPGALSQKRLKKKLFLMLFQSAGWQQRIKWHATDEQEIKFIQRQFGNNVRAETAGNFPNLLPLAAVPEKKTKELVMGTVALISPMKNHLEVLKALQSVKASISWHIYGPVKEQAYWQQCKELMQHLPPGISVVYHGEVPPAELSVAMNKFQVFIMPSKSENFGHALLEALSAGKPVITTDTTPFKDLQENKAGYTVQASHLADELPLAIGFFAAMKAEEFAAYSTGAADYARNFLATDRLKHQYQHLFTTA